jgi:hypothetical protein
MVRAMKCELRRGHLGMPDMVCMYKAVRLLEFSVLN